ncbi:porphobilinogen synthase [Planctomycetota bacterium]|nr:porphobilinogen synthase [Planctomycetota bacterium]
MLDRPRRNRKSAAIRGLVRETRLSAEQLIYPLFVHEDADDTPLESLPGQTRWSIDGLVTEVKRAYSLGIRAVVIFPKVPENKKTPKGDECFNPDGLVPHAVKAIKEGVPEMAVITDVALDPYNSDGHDGIVHDGEILNDETIDVLCKQAVMQAQAGADIVAPSDMMDGRVAAIREELDDAGFDDVSIMSYTAKYASAFYGPFRGALESAPKAGDKKTYQMDPANYVEALREAALDEAEGADMLMVKPAGPYLDVIAGLAGDSTLPIAAYQVSGEYLMIKAAAQSGWLDEKAAVLESLTGIVRAGASMVLTYFAPDAAEWLG